MVRMSDIIKRKKLMPEKPPAATTKPPITKSEKEEIKVAFPRMEGRNKAEEVYEETLGAVKAQFDSVSQGKELYLSEKIEMVAARIVEMLSAGDESLIGLITRVSKENYLYNHSVNTCILAVKVGLPLGFNTAELRELAVCALLHDLGMAKVPKEIWAKPGKLSKEEFSEVKKHSIYGQEILAKMAGISPLLAEVAHQHHETVNGEGYPRQINEEEIHDYAKLIGVIDVYEALTHERAYRKEYMPSDAIKMIMDGSGHLFSSRMVRALVEELSLYPTGSLVELNTNEVGEVVKANKGFPLRPRLRIITDPSNNKLERPKIVDLVKQTSLYIKRTISQKKS